MNILKETNDKEHKLWGVNYCKNEIDNDQYGDEAVSLSNLTMIQWFFNWLILIILLFFNLFLNSFYFYQKDKNAEKKKKCERKGKYWKERKSFLFFGIFWQ